jgi:hypothetical protein
MNYNNFHDMISVYDAFVKCQDAGEQIDLFEALAWRDEPPVEAFKKIVTEIKLEPCLALAIQALGWVKNTEILKKDDDLLKILSDLASSGVTDLIQWSAAKSIIAIGFDSLYVSQNLTKMPTTIVNLVIKSNLRLLEKRDIHNEESFLDFWIYSDTAQLRYNQHVDRPLVVRISEKFKKITFI